MVEILIFDVWADFAHFKKIYTTTSPLSYSIPPRPTLSGLISAILGLDKLEYLNSFQKKEASITVQLLNPVKKIRVATNFIDTKKSMPYLMAKILSRTQIRMELLKDVKFRIFFQHTNNSLFNDAVELIQEHQSVYTPCLGLSQFIANFEFKSVETGQKISNVDKFTRIDSVIPSPVNGPLKIDFEPDCEYIQEIMPINMLPDRTVSEYSPITFERNAKHINAKGLDCWKLETGENIVFL